MNITKVKTNNKTKFNSINHQYCSHPIFLTKFIHIQVNNTKLFLRGIMHLFHQYIILIFSQELLKFLKFSLILLTIRII